MVRMSHNSGQLDISERLTMASNSQPKASEWTEIGQVEVIHTIFGKAKVRIIRKHDKMRRLIFLVASVAVVIVLWEGWILFQRYVPVQNIYSYFHSSSDDNMSFAVSPPDKMPASDSTRMMKSQNKTNSENVTDTPDDVLKDKPAQPQINISSGKIAGQPIAQRPLTNVKPPLAPHAASNVAPTNVTHNVPIPNQAPKPLFPKTPLPVRAAQSSNSSPVTDVPLVVPASKEETAPAPEGENQAVDPAGAKQ
jgi:hypothetical protein